MEQKIPTRYDTYVLIRILSILYENGEYRKTKLAWAANLNYNTLLIYIQLLLKEKMINILHDDAGHDLIRINNNGVEMLSDISKHLPIIK